MLARFAGILSFAGWGKLRKISVNIRKLAKVEESWGKCDKKSLYLCSGIGEGLADGFEGLLHGVYLVAVFGSPYSCVGYGLKQMQRAESTL